MIKHQRLDRWLCVRCSDCLHKWCCQGPCQCLCRDQRVRRPKLDRDRNGLSEMERQQQTALPFGPEAGFKVGAGSLKGADTTEKEKT